MKRSIIQLGGKTSVISLPQHWVEKLGLKKKDEVEVTERGEELIVSPQKNQSNKVIKIKLSAKDKRFIRNLFLILGSLAYDEVEIEVNNREIMSLLHETAQTFSSFVLVEQDKTRCVYRTVSKESKEDFDQDKTCFVYLLLWNLEVIADFYRRACYFLAENTKKGFKLSKKLVELIGKANLLLNKLSHLPKKSPVQDFIDLFALKAEIGDEMESIFKSGKYEEIIIGHYVMDIITYVQDCSIAYLGVLYGKEDGETDK
jgi:antitoxin component of MazEF toxin-antitoxin module